MSNIGKIIQDNYCNGFAADNYDMQGAVIILENDRSVVCIKRSGEFIVLDFAYEEKGEVLIRKNKQEFIDDWCKKTEGKFFED